MEDNSNSRRAMLEHIAFSGSSRCITGHTRTTGTTIKFLINQIYEYVNSSWTVVTAGTEYTAVSDNDGYFEVVLPDDLVITSLASMCETGESEDQLVDINVSKMGDVSQCTSMLYMFGSQNYLETVSGFAKFTSATANRTCEGMFRSNKAIVTADLTGLCTDGMDKSIVSRYGFPVAFYNVASLTTLTLPAIPATAYMGSATFSGCTSLRNVSCSGELACDHLYFADCPLTLTSMRNILSHLSANPASGATCTFAGSSWSNAIADDECMGYINTAKANGWTLPDIPIYANDCTNAEDFVMNSYYICGVEDDASNDRYGFVWVVMNQTSSTPTTYWTFDFDGSFDFSSATKMTINMKGVTAGLTRGGVTIQSSSYAPVNMQLIDSTGATSDWISPIAGGTVAAGSTSTGTLTFADVTGSADLSKITGFNMMFNNTTDSAKTRKKGIWFSGITVS